MSKALLIIDYSHDFIADDGALSCGKPGQNIDKSLAEAVNNAAQEGGFIFIINDEHETGDVYHPESKLFPPHNIKDSLGAEIYGETGRAVKTLRDAGYDKICCLPKTRYSAFFATPLSMLLHTRGVDHVVVAGVCTDICVLHTVIDATYADFKVSVIEQGCAALTESGHDWAIAHMKNVLAAEII